MISLKSYLLLNENVRTGTSYICLGRIIVKFSLEFFIRIFTIDRNFLYIDKGKNQSYNNILGMSFFYFFVPPGNLSSNFSQQDFQGFNNQYANPNAYTQQKFVIPSTFTNSQLTFTEYPCYPSQQDYMVPTFQSLPQLQTEPL